MVMAGDSIGDLYVYHIIFTYTHIIYYIYRYKLSLNLLNSPTLGFAGLGKHCDLLSRNNRIHTKNKEDGVENVGLIW